MGQYDGDVRKPLRRAEERGRDVSEDGRQGGLGQGRCMRRLETPVRQFVERQVRRRQVQGLSGGFVRRRPVCQGGQGGRRVSHSVP